MLRHYVTVDAGNRLDGSADKRHTAGIRAVALNELPPTSWLPCEKCFLYLGYILKDERWKRMKQIK